MALVLPQTNNGLHHKPLSLINPNHSNPSILSINLKHQSILCPPIQTAFRSRLRLFPVAKGLDKHSDQSNVQGGDDDDNIGVKAALSMLRFYKREISPLMPNSCRYVPTCSEYSMIAYKKYGVVKGSILTAWRLCRCNPVADVLLLLSLGKLTNLTPYNKTLEEGLDLIPQDGLTRKVHQRNEAFVINKFKRPSLLSRAL